MTQSFDSILKLYEKLVYRFNRDDMLDRLIREERDSLKDFLKKGVTGYSPTRILQVEIFTEDSKNFSFYRVCSNAGFSEVIMRIKGDKLLYNSNLTHLMYYVKKLAKLGDFTLEPVSEIPSETGNVTIVKYLPLKNLEVDDSNLITKSKLISESDNGSVGTTIMESLYGYVRGYADAGWATTHDGTLVYPQEFSDNTVQVIWSDFNTPGQDNG